MNNHNFKQKEHYDRYYSGNEIKKDPIKSRFVLRFLDSLNLTEGDEVLEIGCGDGTLTQYLLDRGLKVTGVDISATAVDKLKESKSGYIAEGKLELICSDLVEYAKKNKNRFDGVIGAGIIHHIEENIWDDFFEAAYNALKKSGIFACAPEPGADLINGVLWRFAGFVYNRIYKIDYNNEVEKGTLDMKTGKLKKAMRKAGFSKCAVKPYQVIPHFNIRFIAAVDSILVRFISSYFSLYTIVKGYK